MRSLSKQEIQYNFRSDLKDLEILFSLELISTMEKVFLTSKALMSRSF